MFTVKLRATMTVSEDGIQLNIGQDEREKLLEYLEVIVPEYVQQVGDQPISEAKLIELAAKWQIEHPHEEMTEPVTKLPYDVEVRYGAMLQEISKATGVSQAQLITTMVNKSYQKVVKERDA
ncbi:hypothetical protein B8V81_5090 [Paenibacillus pasadenensis]|uniref:Uncharacterized protein n=1 Tax=Paenibacillus pasadenensis TaxID=217090 RepID=A0A2N5MZN6_9BACL|nr:hypothetical protein B8V81_5090 [Paenibacillus pasadenensis]